MLGRGGSLGRVTVGVGALGTEDKGPGAEPAQRRSAERLGGGQAPSVLKEDQAAGTSSAGERGKLAEWRLGQRGRHSEEHILPGTLARLSQLGSCKLPQEDLRAKIRAGQTATCFPKAPGLQTWKKVLSWS
uniref:Uncharacterized protein n=1 Tax=Sphaerodactylus townsendi TaxID=933632 RepID=A0ACB8FET3_9SAUR